MKKIALFSLVAGALSGFGPTLSATPATPDRPNVIVLIADDLGYGDLSCYGAKAIRTPNMDRLASRGIRFTRGYAASATSSPSRYALLTGMYPWRNNIRILPGDSPLIIPTERPSMAMLFRNAGYATAAVGKWHLGLGEGTQKNWNKPIAPGPKEIGFDYSFIMAATNDRVPCVYFSNGCVVGLDPSDPIEVNYQRNFAGEPTGRTHPDLLKMHPSPNHGHADSIVAGVSRIGFMKGGKAARWDDATMADVFSEKARGFITGNKDRPFFLYYALHQPHVPRVPNSKFSGKSGLGPRGDVILEADAQIGELLDCLEKNGLDKNTMIVFTSDNGPVLDDGYADDAVEKAHTKNHRPAGMLRGGKYSLFEAGTRVPFVVWQPGTIKPGVSEVPVAQLDCYASFARMLGEKVPPGTDSVNTLDVFRGRAKRSARKDFVVEATSRLAYRAGDWVYIPPHKGAKVAWLTGIETGNDERPALYRIDGKAQQLENLAEKHPKKLAEMQAAFEKARSNRVP